MKAFHCLGFLVLSSGLLACSGGKVNIGDHAAIGSQLSDYAGSWDGYAEAYQFESSGSDRIRVVLNGGGEGTVEVGDADPLPPPTDPNVGYPPVSSEPMSMPYQASLVPGFDYPVYDTLLESSRIRFDVKAYDLFAAWCAIETPVLDQFNTQEPTYSCVPNWGFQANGTSCSQQNPDTGQWVPVDCVKLSLCQSRVCLCTADGCTVNQGPTYQMDGALDSTGNELVGTLVIGSNRVTVRLARQ